MNAEHYMCVNLFSIINYPKRETAYQYHFTKPLLKIYNQ